MYDKVKLDFKELLEEFQAGAHKTELMIQVIDRLRYNIGVLSQYDGFEELDINLMNRIKTHVEHQQNLNKGLLGYISLFKDSLDSIDSLLETPSEDLDSADRESKDQKLRSLGDLEDAEKHLSVLRENLQKPTEIKEQK